MEADCRRTKVLITVMTYPHPSRRHEECVCTAGITEDLEWVRLYSIDYRYRPHNQQFRKYQWIEIELDSKGSGNDNRKESRKPYLETIKLLGNPLSTKKHWVERREIIDKMPVHTVKQLGELYRAEKISLGIVRPTKIIDLVIEETDREWKEDWQMIYDQVRLFGPQAKPLEKIPYKFSYKFECEDGEHKAMIEDWELGVLFLRERRRLGSEEQAINSVCNNYFNRMCSSTRDTFLFMGTTFPFPSWVVLGVYYPPKLPNQSNAIDKTAQIALF